MQRMQRTLVDADCSVRIAIPPPESRNWLHRGKKKMAPGIDPQGGPIMSLREGKGQSKTERDMVKVNREKQ